MLRITERFSLLKQKNSATLADIAERAGVATMTVSRVINENGYVSDETRERVLRVARELNYRRNALARGLKRQRTEAVGLVLGDIANPFGAELARGVREVLAARNYTLFMCVSERSAREDITAFDSLADHRMDGIIVATRASKLGNDRLAEIIEMNIPVVLIGRDFWHPLADLVTADNLRGGYEAATHLISLGHRRIGFVGASLSSVSGLKRFQGYIDAMREHGLSIDEKLIVGSSDRKEQVPGYATEEMGFECMKQLLAMSKPPTAIFARNDITALGAISAIKSAGLRIPQDMAVVGYDDIPLARHTSPPLTTVRQPTREQGRLAAELLLRRVESREPPGREEKVLDCELIVRESTIGATQ